MKLIAGGWPEKWEIVYENDGYSAYCNKEKLGYFHSSYDDATDRCRKVINLKLSGK